MPRNPNTECFTCKKSIYRRPVEIEKWKNVFCSKECYGKSQLKRKEIICPVCNTSFLQEKPNQIYCSKKCVGVHTRNRKAVKKPFKNNTQFKLFLLKEAFNFNSCMIVGCNYSKTYDVHRFIEGKNGGKYEIGNMFAICPNHHAEIHRGLCKVRKIDNKTLEIIKGE